MKNLIMTLFSIFSINLITATESEDAFCMNKLQKQQLEIADMWMIFTHELGGTPVLGQFYRCGYSTLEQNSLTIEEVSKFLLLYSDKLGYDMGNYFLLKQDGKFSLLSVERVENNLFFKITDLYETIQNHKRIYIMIPIPIPKSS